MFRFVFALAISSVLVAWGGGSDGGTTASLAQLEIRLTDIVKGTTVKYNPPSATASGWFLQGGSTPPTTLPAPTGYRLFGGSSVAGNTLAFDNVSIGGALVASYGAGPGRPNVRGSLIVRTTAVA